MAQVSDGTKTFIERMRLVLGQRPAYAAAAVLAAGLLLGAGALGVVQAGSTGGIVIGTAADTSEEAAADAGEEDAADEAADDGADADVEADAGESDTVVVDVDGAVASPSVVELPAGSRVADAIEAAGGLTAEADVSGINRAAVLSDGEKIYIPEEGEDASTSTSSGSSTSSSSATSSSTASSGLVNINTADAEELDTLPGIGEVLAQAIIDDREANGAFTSIEDIMRVSGIGEAKFANIQDLICV